MLGVFVVDNEEHAREAMNENSSVNPSSASYSVSRSVTSEVGLGTWFLLGSS